MNSDEVPRYRATIDLIPSPNFRHRHEQPLSTVMDPSVWQQATSPLAAGEEISTREWCHASMQPLNQSAKMVWDFFTTRTKSRLPQSPFLGNELRLDDGVSGNLPEFNPRPAA